MTAIHPDDAVYDKPVRASIPRIKFLSWLGLESIGWAIVIGHLVKWAIDALYFLIVQVKYQVGYNGSTWTIWYLKDAWDRLPVHVSNLLGAHWFGGSQTVPEWWVTARHDTRDVLIGLIAGVIVTFLFTKPKNPDDVEVSAFRYAITLPYAIVAAIPGITLVALLALQLPWLNQHGVFIHGGSVLANEVNSFLYKGLWIAAVMGIAGSQLFARFVTKKPADAAQWFYAERSAAAIRSDSALGQLRGSRVVGTPSHRVRVHYLLANEDQVQAHSIWAVRILTSALGVGLLLAGFGAWLTLAGPAAPH